MSASGSETTLDEILDALRDPTRLLPPASNALVPACVVCRLAARSVERHVRDLFAEFVNDIRLRDTFRQAGGFCPTHTQQVAGLGDALGVAILLSDLARLTRERWQAASSAKPSLFRLRRAAVLPCTACTAYFEGEARYVAALAAHLSRDAVWNALDANALCIAHSEAVAEAAPPTMATKWRRHEAERLTVLQAELETIIRHNDYRFRDEPWGEEKNAWLRALQKLTRSR